LIEGVGEPFARRMFGHDNENITRKWIKLLKEEVHDLILLWTTK
jgi:hypothetical protein